MGRFVFDLPLGQVERSKLRDRECFRRESYVTAVSPHHPGDIPETRPVNIVHCFA